tara:strand:+ start:4208 stop:5647 length:1440 start_codon:yes stop_codon:yes gene_type:complete
MKRFSEQLHTKAKSVKLRAAERNELRERVVAYMEYHPLPAEMKVKKAKKVSAAPVLTEPFATVKIPFHNIFKVTASLAVLIMVVVPFVAERAVPGDVLYAVKVQFNEELRGSLTFDSVQKVEWETERLNRRIAEARLLASEGRLTEEAEAEVAEAVRTHSENAKREIEELRTEDADAAAIASIALDSTLEVQSTSLKNEETVEEGEVTTGSVNLIADAIDKSRVEASPENASTTLPAYDKLMARVEQNTTRIYELIASLEGVIEEDSHLEVTRRAQDLDRAIVEAVETAANDQLTAREQLVAVLQRTQRLVVFITDLQVVNTVDIETVIPVVLTEEEKEEARLELKTTIEDKSAEMQTRLELVEDEGIIEKTNALQADIAERLENLASTTDFVAYVDLAEETIAIADNAIKVLEINRVRDPLPPEELIEEVASTTATTTEEIVIDEEEAVEGVEVEELVEEVPLESEAELEAAVDTEIE